MIDPLLHIVIAGDLPKEDADWLTQKIRAAFVKHLGPLDMPVRGYRIPTAAAAYFSFECKNEDGADWQCSIEIGRHVLAREAEPKFDSFDAFASQIARDMPRA